MREQKTCSGNEDFAIYCNKCGKELSYSNGMFKEGVLQIIKEWDYFSKKDLEVHQFNVCEDCYERMIEDFIIPIDIKEKREVL